MPRLHRRASQHGGILLKFMVLLVGALAALALVWMALLPYVIASHLRNRTGFDVAFQSLMVNPFTGEIRARGFVINNPPTFPRPEFLQIREITARADVWSFFSNKPVVDRLDLDIGLVALVKRADGRTNMDVFRSYLEGNEGHVESAPARETAPSFLIHKLHVRFDRLLVADYTHRKPVVRDYPVKLDRTFTHVTNSRQLLLPNSLNQLFELGGSVGTMLPKGIERVLDQVLQSGKDLMGRVQRTNTKALEGFSDALEESKKP